MEEITIENPGQVLYNKNEHLFELEGGANEW